MNDEKLNVTFTMFYKVVPKFHSFESFTNRKESLNLKDRFLQTSATNVKPPLHVETFS